jgi:protein-tyrosine-phosphatase
MNKFERVLRTLPHAPDRLLHKFRRDRAVREVRRAIPKSILFVCHGNLCRSPFAAALFSQMMRELLPFTISATSAGFVSPGRTAPSQAVAAAAKHGATLDGHTSRLISERAIRAADLIVVMSADQARMIRRVGAAGDGAAQNARILVLGELDPLPVQARTIVDPWGRSDEIFEESYARIERCVGELVRALADVTG